MSAAILERLGLTPEAIRRHVVSVAPPLPAWKNKTRAKYLAQGLTALGKPRKRRKRSG